VSTTGGIPGMPEPTLRLSVPEEGIRDGDLLLRPPREEDVDAFVAAIADPELREAGNLLEMGRAEALATLPHLPALAASGRTPCFPASSVESETGYQWRIPGSNR
jgi:hypothetical protein